MASDLSNLSSACLTDYGAPTIHRNIPRASIEVDFELDLRPYLSVSIECSLKNISRVILNML